MIKRKIYLTLSVLTIVLTIVLIAQIAKINIFIGIGMFIFIQLIFFIVSITITLFQLVKYDIDIGFPSLIFPFGVFTFSYKEIYYSNLGYFYARYSNDKVHIYEQGVLLSKRLFSVDFNDNLDILALDIENNLDELNRNKKNKKNNKFKSWDGYIDTKSKREGKINKLFTNSK